MRRSRSAAHGGMLVAIIACLVTGAERRGEKVRVVPTADRGSPAASTENSAKPNNGPNLDGVWVGYVVDGKGEQPDRGSVHLELTIQGNHISARRLDGEENSLGEGTYKMVIGKPITMDGTEIRALGKARTYRGICTFASDTIKWCVAMPGGKRPRTFETKGQQFYLILKRVR